MAILEDKVLIKYIKFGDRPFDKLVIGIGILLFLFYRALSRIILGKKNRDNLLERKNITIRNFVPSNFVINIDGMKYYMNKNYSNFALSVSTEPNIFDFIKKTLKPGQTYVDIGCYIGFYALHSAKLVGAEGKVIAIDANPENIEIVKKNVEINKISNLAAYNFAITDKDGYSDFYLTKLSAANSLQKRELFPTIAKIKIQTSTLDTLDSLKSIDEIDLLKIDIEGSEVDCLKGARHVLEKTRNIIVECHSTQNKHRVEKFLQKNFSVKELDFLEELDCYHLACQKKGL